MILVGGENLIDMVPLPEAVPNSFQALPGGSPFNCAMALGRQGQKVGYLTPISNDSLGDLLAAKLISSDVQLLSKRREEPTSLAVVSLQDGVASYQFYRNGTAERMVSLKGLIESTPDDAMALHLGSLTLAGGADADIWAEYYCKMHGRGMFTSLDPNIRAAFIHKPTEYVARLDLVLKHTDLLKLSDEDLSWLYPDEDIIVAAAKLARRSSAKILIVTLGEDGSFALSNGQVIRVGAAHVPKLQDTIGAGDTFMATLLAHLARNNALTAKSLEEMNGSDLQELQEWATQAAALNCAEIGCSPPVYQTLEALLGSSIETL